MQTISDADIRRNVSSCKNKENQRERLEALNNPIPINLKPQIIWTAAISNDSNEWTLKTLIASHNPMKSNRIKSNFEIKEETDGQHFPKRQLIRAESNRPFGVTVAQWNSIEVWGGGGNGGGNGGRERGREGRGVAFFFPADGSGDLLSRPLRFPRRFLSPRRVSETSAIGELNLNALSAEFPAERWEEGSFPIATRRRRQPASNYSLAFRFISRR